MSIKFESRSVNEAFARQAVGAFASQLDPTMEELGDIKTVVSEAVTNAIVHGYAGRSGFITVAVRLFEGRALEIKIKDTGCGIGRTSLPRNRLRHRKRRAGEKADVYHRRRFAQRHGFYHHGKLHRPASCTLCAGARHGRDHDQGPAGAGDLTERMTALLRRASEGDREAESVLISENSGLIHTIARRYFGRGAEPDDLYQLACVGFIKAVRGFDPARGNEFSTYAVPKIAGEIRRFLRDDGAVKVSRAVKERAVRVRRVQSELEGRLGRSPSVSELAAACALTPEEVAVCEQADVSVDSLERELSGGGRLGDLVGDEGMEERTCLYLSLEEALLSLPERERQVIALRFARDMTQQQVSRIIGVSQVQVSRIEKRALAALREKLCDT